MAVSFRTLAWRDGVPADAPADIHGIKDALADPDLLLWADIVKPTRQDLILLAEELGVGRNALEDAVAPYERPKASQEDGYQYFVTYATLPGFASTADDEDDQLSRVAGFAFPGGLITVRRTGALDMEPVVRRWHNDRRLLRLGTPALVHGLLDVVVDGYTRSSARRPLVVVGSAPYADEYTRRVESLADARVRLLGGVWDQELLDQLYTGALVYHHGHSVGGTNPSLLRAIGAGTAVDAFDVSFNREVLGEAGRYWSDADDVAGLVDSAEADPAAQLERGARSLERARLYDWDEVADRYEALARRLAAQGPSRHRPSGRRAGVSG